MQNSGSLFLEDRTMGNEKAQSVETSEGIFRVCIWQLDLNFGLSISFCPFVQFLQKFWKALRTPKLEISSLAYS